MVITKMTAPPIPAAVSTSLGYTEERSRCPRNWLKTTLLTIAELTSDQQVILSCFLASFRVIVLLQVSQPAQSSASLHFGSIAISLAAPILNLFWSAVKHCQNKECSRCKDKDRDRLISELSACCEWKYLMSKDQYRHREVHGHAPMQVRLKVNPSPIPIPSNNDGIGGILHSICLCTAKDDTVYNDQRDIDSKCGVQAWDKSL